MDAVLQQLEIAGVKLNAKKCQLLREETVIMGHVVSQKGVATDPEKMKALMHHMTYPHFVRSWDALATTDSSFLISPTSHLHFTTSREKESTSSGLYTASKRSIRYEIV